ncbi:hypothetical protein [Actinoplanes sp. NPDC089786]|uniref:hypothetical protein n=1 Tax=Actinoplanes sp. NPDC089786 TaxID=3155185 RepID=UPI00342BCBD9
MDDPARRLRFVGGLAAIVFAIGPALMLALLVAQGSAPRPVIGLLAVGIPVNVVAIVFAVRAMVAPSPELSARRTGIAWGLVAVGLVVLLGGNALLRIFAGE